jgi:hypothetical protein
MKITITLSSEQAADIRVMAKELAISARWMRRILSSMAFVSMGKVTRRRIVDHCAFSSQADAARAARVIFESGEPTHFNDWEVETRHGFGKNQKAIIWIKPKAKRYKVLEGLKNVRVCFGLAA